MARSVFILGSPNAGDGTLSLISLSRITRAIKEQQEVSDIVLLATGGFGAHFNKTKTPHRELVYRQLEAFGAVIDRANPNDLLSSNTVEDMTLIAEFAELRGISSYDIVTSNFHAARCRFILKCFAHSHLVNVLTADDPNDLDIEIVQHEDNALTQLKSQGGVFLEGILHPYSEM
ncbi:YdcF family protein [Parasphingorhabdus cellanae]|uniref:YdcF family protein n=1 Tax=Parasphingorhabdus cellanae TaxID=2806553 RepID=A0ABX7T247_9SPHN|nr:ElyC/SanA/YdcF family protein [Parasphingorhabdus cellanae]QTD54602.1 YdcF family protein [Parasphingorhabdus cellanae]